jgi:hypothetical protein
VSLLNDDSSSLDDEPKSEPPSRRPIVHFTAHVPSITPHIVLSTYISSLVVLLAKWVYKIREVIGTLVGDMTNPWRTHS